MRIWFLNISEFFFLLLYKLLRFFNSDVIELSHLRYYILFTEITLQKFLDVDFAFLKSCEEFTGVTFTISPHYLTCTVDLLTRYTTFGFLKLFLNVLLILVEIEKTNSVSFSNWIEIFRYVSVPLKDLF